MSKTKGNENRFIKEVKLAARENPNVDIGLVREWLEITKILDSVPKDSEPEPKPVKRPNLQPIPLRMFIRN